MADLSVALGYAPWKSALARIRPIPVNSTHWPNSVGMTGLNAACRKIIDKIPAKKASRMEPLADRIWAALG